MIRIAAPGRVPRDARAVPRAVRGRGRGDRRRGRGRVLGRRVDDEATTGRSGDRFAANMAAYGIADRPADRTTSAARTWATSAGSSRRSTRDSRSAPTGVPGPLDRVPRRRRLAAGPTRSRCSPRRSSPRPPTTCSPTRRSSRPPGRSSAAGLAAPRAPLGPGRDRRAARSASGRAPGREGATDGCYHRRRRAPLDAGCEPAAPPETE